MKATKLVTRDTMNIMLNESKAKQIAVIGRALVAIFKYQTASEQGSNSTVEQNGVGFAGCDAYGGSMTAKYFMRHNTLQGWQVEKWMKVGKNGYPRICKYHAQLNTIAKGRA